ncbi:MAG: VCBS repeat-containing protein [Deltaproteobacteria bacterium]|nr:VCBS repeat-containing protein [Deltaproteobacteria bacterium]
MIAITAIGAGCFSIEAQKSSSIERIGTNSVEGLLGSENPQMVMPGSGGGPTDLIRERGFSSAAWSALLGTNDDKYEVCDAGPDNSPACGGTTPWAGVHLTRDTAQRFETANGYFYFNFPYRIDPNAESARVIPLKLVDLGNPGTQDDYLRPSDYQVPLSNVTQVFNYLTLNASATDSQEQDLRVGAIDFLRPGAQAGQDYTWAYAALRNGIVATINTDTDAAQQPAQIDLMSTDYNDNQLWMLRGSVQGDVGFSSDGSRSTQASPTSIAKADLEGDGDLDVVVANSGAGTITIFLGLGGGGLMPFDSGTVYSVGANPVAVATGDLDNDSKPDVAVLRKVASGGGAGCTVTVLRGNGNGTMSAGTDFPCGTSSEEPTGVAIGRFDVNGKLDVWVTKFSASAANAGKIAVLVNVSTSGTINFTYSGTNDLAVGKKPMALALGNFNADGNIDVVTANFDDDTATVVLGNGTGGAISTSTQPVSDGPRAVAVGFLDDADTYLDFVTANDRAGAGDDISVVRGNGNGTFQTAAQYPLLNNGNTTSAGPRAIVVGEFSEDTIADIAVTDFDANKISVFKGLTNNTYSLSTPSAYGGSLSQPYGLVAAEFSTQREDITYLGNPNHAADRGPNAGYGIKIVEYPAGSGQAYAFVTNHTQDTAPSLSGWPCQSSGAAWTIADGPTGGAKFISNTVTVIQIDTKQFPPSNELLGNDKIIATLKVGCGPEGIDALSDGSYVFVANAYDGTVSRIDVPYLLNHLPSGAFDPSTNGVDPAFDLKGVAGLPSPNGALLNRGLDVVEGIPNAGGPNTPGERLFVTYGYPTGSTSGGVAVLTNLRSSSISVDAAANGAAFGGFPVGIQASPAQVLVQNPNAPGTVLGWGIRLVIASDQCRSCSPSGYVESDTASIADVYYACSGSTCSPAAYLYGPLVLTKGCAEASVGPNCVGTVSGSIDVNAAGTTAYIARQSAASGAGLVALDINGTPFPTNPQARVLGAVGQTDGLFAVKRLPIAAGASDPLGKKHKLYQGNSSTASGSTLKGVWVAPEPLIMPAVTHSLQSAAFDSTWHYVGGAPTQLLGRAYANIRSPSIRPVDGAKIAYARNDFDLFAGQNLPSPFKGRLVVSNSDGSSEQVLTSYQPDATGTVSVPSWIPGTTASQSSNLVFTQVVDRVSYGCGTGTASDVILMDYLSTANPKQTWDLTCDDVNRKHGDATGGFVTAGSSTKVTVVFTRQEDITIDGCGEVTVQSLWKRDFDLQTQSFTGSITQLTDPTTDPKFSCAGYVAGRALGDYDPEISTAPFQLDGQGAAVYWIAFSRRLDSRGIQAASDAFGDHDIMIVSLDGSRLYDQTAVDDGSNSKCGSAASHLCADETPSWRPTPSSQGSQQRIVFVVVRSDPADLSDIVTIQPTQFATSGNNQNDRREVDSALSDRDLDGSPGWYPGSTSGDAFLDIVFHRLNLDPSPPGGTLDLYPIFHSMIQ